VEERPVKNPLFKANELVFKQVNRVKEWHELPRPLAALNLRAFRDELREQNLYDTNVADEGDGGPATVVDPESLPKHRTYDGSLTDAHDPDMGRAGARFGRNHPLGLTIPEKIPLLMQPNPRVVSTSLLNRDTFKPATSLNVLAAAWIQFQNHDWFSHGDNSPDRIVEVPLEEGDDWGEPTMKVRSTSPDPHPSGKEVAPTYVNTVTHWWDGSQIYASEEKRNRMLRTHEDGKMIVEDDRLPAEDNPKLPGIDLTGFSDNYWVGLSMLHTLFVKEHNAICDHLKRHNPGWDDEKLFLTARLVNSALMAKIHTVEWTPGILATPVLKTAMHANWYGMLPAWAKKMRIDSLEALFGVVGGHAKHHAAPYAITQEFVSVYRMHPLIPDDWEMRHHQTHELVGEEFFDDIQGATTREVVDKYGWSDLFYSFGVAHPGAMTLHNHPRALQNHRRLNGDRVDIGTIDILRDRERGIPRYNDFREKLRKPRITRWEDITDDPRWAAEIRDVYEGQIDRVDLHVGLLAETPPKGFGFSDTAFRIFILMASRRLKSDRFFTDDYNSSVYTPEGLRWVEDTTMADVLRRHHPELSPALAGVENAFAPWQRVG
jgi:Animal haem peroxidase